MRVALDLAGAGAVTAAGLTAPQTCAAVRAALSGLTTIMLADPFGVPQAVARVPGHAALRRTDAEWLVAMAARALREALEGAGEAPPPGRALYLVPPEGARRHPGLAELSPEAMLAEVAAAAGLVPNAASRVLDGGAAAALGSLAFAAEAMARGEAAEVLVVAVDSLLNAGDLRRLARAGRLRGPDNAQGLVPGEGASALRLRPRAAAGPGAALALSVATTREPDGVEGARMSQGRGLLAAMEGAAGPAGGAGEAELAFVVTTANGERYGQWEAMLARTRFFRTRREALPVVHPAMAVGETGAAAAGVALAVLRDALLNGHAPGPLALVEAASEGGLRSAAVVGLAA